MQKKDLKTNGPGKLCKYYGITKDHDGVRLFKRILRCMSAMTVSKFHPKQIISAPRVGVDYAGEAAQWPLRFYIKDNIFVSRI